VPHLASFANHCGVLHSCTEFEDAEDPEALKGGE
jgi:hypothetical protein